MKGPLCPYPAVLQSESECLRIEQVHCAALSLPYAHAEAGFAWTQAGFRQVAEGVIVVSRKQNTAQSPRNGSSTSPLRVFTEAVTGERRVLTRSRCCRDLRLSVQECGDFHFRGGRVSLSSWKCVIIRVDSYSYAGGALQVIPSKVLTSVRPCFCFGLVRIIIKQPFVCTKLTKHM